MRLADWVDYDFENLLAFAKQAKKTTGNDDQFLQDIEEKYEEYGNDMYWSDAQRDYLQFLAIRGGFRG